jgi:hypothetical protein
MWWVFEGLLCFWMICWLHEKCVLNGEFHLMFSLILFLIEDYRYIVL